MQLRHDQTIDSETAIARIIAGLHHVKESDLRDIFKMVWLAEFNALCEFGYADQNGSMAYVEIVENRWRNNQIESNSETAWECDMLRKPADECERIRAHVIERFGTIRMFRAWIRFADSFRNVELADNGNIETAWSIETYKLVELVEWLATDDIPDSLAAVNAVADTIIGDKFDRTISEFGESIRLQGWKNGKRRISGLTDDMRRRFRELKDAIDTSWFDCTLRKENKVWN